MGTSTVELTDAIDTLGLAYHEVGHGLVARASGMAVRRLRLERSWSGRVTCGYTLLKQPEPDAGTTVWRGYAVMLFAGVTAQTRYLDQAGDLTSRVQAVLDKNTGDFEDWLQHRHLCGITESAARRAAAAYCDTHWPRMTRLAERLATNFQLSGSAL